MTEDEPPLRLQPTPAEVAASAETIVDLRAKLERTADVVAKARELQVAYDDWLRSPCIITDQSPVIKIGEAHRCLAKALAVLDDPGKQEQADGEEG
jgi:hypothetical protein